VGDIVCESTVTNMVAVRNFASVKEKSDIISNKFNVTIDTHDDNDDDDKAVNRKVGFVRMYEATRNVKTSSTFASNVPEA
jgi:hypothetical protein